MRMRLLDSQFQVIVHRCQEIKAGTCKHLILSTVKRREKIKTHTHLSCRSLYLLSYSPGPKTRQWYHLQRSGSSHRNLSKVNVRRIRGCGGLNSKWDIRTTPILIRLRNHCEGGKKRLQEQARVGVCQTQQNKTYFPDMIAPLHIWTQSSPDSIHKIRTRWSQVKSQRGWRVVHEVPYLVGDW